MQADGISGIGKWQKEYSKTSTGTAGENPVISVGFVVEMQDTIDI